MKFFRIKPFAIILSLALAVLACLTIGYAYAYLDTYSPTNKETEETPSNDTEAEKSDEAEQGLAKLPPSALRWQERNREKFSSPNFLDPRTDANGYINYDDALNDVEIATSFALVNEKLVLVIYPKEDLGPLTFHIYVDGYCDETGSDYYLGSYRCELADGTVYRGGTNPQPGKAFDYYETTIGGELFMFNAESFDGINSIILGLLKFGSEDMFSSPEVDL